jgi:uncharacterized membrane protein
VKLGRLSTRQYIRKDLVLGRSSTVAVERSYDQRLEAHWRWLGLVLVLLVIFRLTCAIFISCHLLPPLPFLLLRLLLCLVLLVLIHLFCLLLCRKVQLCHFLFTVDARHPVVCPRRLFLEPAIHCFCTLWIHSLLQ